MAVPIILIHSGNSDYLAYSITQIKQSCPDSEIYLLGDGATKHFSMLINHRYLKNYFRSAEEFAPHFFNRSTNGADYELFCIQRWFILLEFLEANNIESCIYLDSDVLPYTDLDKLAPKLSRWQMTTLYKSPHTNFIHSRDILAKFCAFIKFHYSTPEGKTLLEQYYREHYAIFADRGGISDMTFFLMFRRRHPDLVGNICPPGPEGAFDITMEEAQGFVMENKVKKISWQGNTPYGTPLNGSAPVPFNTLHFQGPNKGLIAPFSRPMSLGRKAMVSTLKAIYIAQRVIAKLKKMV
ncbi:MAG: hypothetical protein V4543_17005 [Bacteroidota bacterium]